MLFLESICLPNEIKKYGTESRIVQSLATMDPHSRLSQFNVRSPKFGPPPVSRFVSDMLNKPGLETFSSSTSTTHQKKKAGSRPSEPTSTLLVRRPIATNSRIKQNESYRKDMYLAFVDNALQQKMNVRICLEFSNL